MALDVNPDLNKATLRIDGEIKYDLDRGELNIVDEVARVVIEVRKKMEDDVLLHAVIFELEKRGYTVISPEVSQNLQGT